MCETDVWKPLTLDNALNAYRDRTHVAHCMLWFTCLPHPNSYTVTYAFVQLRYDGLLGFPGGIVDKCVDNINTVIVALKREMFEEIYFSGDITHDNYVYSHFNETQKFVSHFFAKQISLEEAEQLERTHTKAYDFPKESLGLLRVPIGDIRSNVVPSHYMRRFMINFFKQKFAGNVRKQILDVCEKFNIMSPKELEWTKTLLSKP